MQKRKGRTTTDTNRGIRILLLYEKLCQGKKIIKADEATFFNVENRTIQRDLAIIKQLFTEHPEFEKKLKYEWGKSYSNSIEGKAGYIMIQTKPDQQTILVMAKVLLASRAFSRTEIAPLINKLVAQCHPDDQNFVKEMVVNEVYYYHPLQHKKSLRRAIWDLSEVKFRKRCIKISYRKVGSDKAVERIVEPLSIIFSEFYFYLVAYIKDKGYEFPAIYRIDRIESYQELEERNNIPYSHPYKEGELRQKIQFMQSGKLQEIEFKFWGESLEAVLDRLPTAKVIGREGDKYLIRAEVFGRGIKMWLLSQGPYLEVTGPKNFREEMKKAVEEMGKVYWGE